MELVSEVDTSLSAENIAEEKKDMIANIDFKMVSFSLAGKDYAIDIMSVKEIAKTGRFTYVPNTSHFVLGVYNLRGDIIPIIDLRLFFNIPVPERNGNEIENMIIVSIENQIFGVVVDAIDKVVGISKTQIQPPHPLFGDINIKYIYGVIENAGRLYILLDIDRIFGAKGAQLDEKDADENALNANVAQIQGNIQASMPAPSAVQGASNVAPIKANTASAPKSQPSAPVNDEMRDFGFVKDTLASQKKFHVTGINEVWVKKRFLEWSKAHNTTQLQSEKECDDFLKDFYSPCTGTFWTNEYCDALYKALPDNAAKQIHVWDLGCGKGTETYSLACVLKKRYPDSRIRIYAHDVDLINISNAPMLAVADNEITSWLRPYLTKNVNGKNVFVQDIKDCILFEYHDCLNTSNMPASDIIIARDFMSFLTPQGQNALFEQFKDQLKGNGMIILGANETFGGHTGFQAKSYGALTIYTK